MSDCLICDEVAAMDALPDDLVIDGNLVVAYHLPPNDRFPLQYLGRILLVTRRHVDRLGDLTPDEAAAAGLAARLIARALQSLTDVSRVHTAVIGVHHPHFHQHIFPRYEWMPDDADWNALHEYPGAPHGGAVEIAAFVSRMRPHLPRPSS